MGGGADYCHFAQIKLIPYRTKIRRIKLPKMWLGAENFFLSKMFLESIRKIVTYCKIMLWRRIRVCTHSCFQKKIGGQNCRNFNLVQNISVHRKLCPPNFCPITYIHIRRTYVICRYISKETKNGTFVCRKPQGKPMQTLRTKPSIFGCFHEISENPSRNRPFWFLGGGGQTPSTVIEIILNSRYQIWELQVLKEALSISKSFFS